MKEIAPREAWNVPQTLKCAFVLNIDNLRPLLFPIYISVVLINLTFPKSMKAYYFLDIHLHVLIVIRHYETLIYLNEDDFLFKISFYSK